MAVASNDTRSRLLEAARTCLLGEGFARLSTRRVADAAGVPLSQIHYHFGGKQGLVLALLAHENERLASRQRRMYREEAPLWQRYEQACDFLDDDLASGYVRVLQEMIAAGWSNADVAAEVQRLLDVWLNILTEVAREAQERFGSLGPFEPRDVGLLLGMLYLGSEQVILLGHEHRSHEVRTALRRIGRLIRHLEEA